MQWLLVLCELTCVLVGEAEILTLYIFIKVKGAKASS